MVPIPATEKVGDSPIPVFGIESAVESKPKTKPKTNGEDKAYEIALRAYYKAEARGYEPGYEMQDWLDAEAEVVAETKRNT
jgi:Protein of unknown function (DUF2934)